MDLTDIQKRSIFKALSSKTQREVGTDFGFDKHYKGIGIINAVNKVYREVKENPEKYAISPDVVDLVVKSMDSRYQSSQNQKHIIEFTDTINEKELVVGAKKKAWILLNEKLDYLAKNRKAFRNESLMSIAKLAGIVFDKSQIVKGEATEHISLKAKVDDNITTDQAISQLLKFREAFTQDDDGG